MDRSDIEHMAQGFPPSHIGKDHEEVVTELATQLLDVQKQLDAVLAEMVALKNVLNLIITPDSAVLERDHRVEAVAALNTPATDALLNSVRAEALQEVINSGEFSMWVNQGLEGWIKRFNARTQAGDGIDSVEVGN